MDWATSHANRPRPCSSVRSGRHLPAAWTVAVVAVLTFVLALDQHLTNPVVLEFDPKFEPRPPPRTHEIPRDTTLRKTAFHMFTDPHHLHPAMQKSDEELLKSFTPKQVHQYFPPPATRAARPPSEIPSDEALRSKAFAFLTASSQPYHSRRADRTPAESAADFITGGGAARKSPVHASAHVPLFKNVDSGVYRVAARAAAAVDDLIEGRERKQVGAKVFARQAQRSSALVDVPPEQASTAIATASAEIDHEHADSSHPHSNSITHAARGGLPSYVPAPSVHGGIRGGAEGEGLGVGEDGMAASFMEADKAKNDDYQRAADAARQGTGQGDAASVREIPKDLKLRSLAFRYATQDLSEPAKPSSGQACWKGGGCWQAASPEQAQTGALGKSSRTGALQASNPDALPPAPWDHPTAPRRAALDHAPSIAKAGRGKAGRPRLGGPAQWAEIFSSSGGGEGSARVSARWAPKVPEYRGLPKDTRLRRLAHRYMDDGVAYRMQMKVKDEVKKARSALRLAKHRQEIALQRMVRDKDQLRNTAQFVRRQERSLASRIHAAEQRLRRYRKSVDGARAHRSDGTQYGTSESGRYSARVGSGGRLARNQQEVREAEKGVRRAGGGGRSRAEVQGGGGGGGREGERPLGGKLSGALNRGVSDVSSALSSAEFAADLNGRGVQAQSARRRDADARYRRSGSLGRMADEVDRMQRSLSRLRRRSESGMLREREQRDEQDRSFNPL